MDRRDVLSGLGAGVAVLAGATGIASAGEKPQQQNGNMAGSKCLASCSACMAACLKCLSLIHI